MPSKNTISEQNHIGRKQKASDDGLRKWFCRQGYCFNAKFTPSNSVYHYKEVTKDLERVSCETWRSLSTVTSTFRNLHFTRNSVLVGSSTIARKIIKKILIIPMK